VNNPKADWLAWFLQLIFGIVVGIVLGFYLAQVRRGGWWLKNDVVYDFTIGAGLITGAIASQYGDRLWMGDSNSLFPEDGIKQSYYSILCSILIGIKGAGLVIYAVWTTIKVS